MREHCHQNIKMMKGIYGRRTRKINQQMMIKLLARYNNKNKAGSTKSTLPTSNMARKAILHSSVGKDLMRGATNAIMMWAKESYVGGKFRIRRLMVCKEFSSMIQVDVSVFALKANI